MNGSSTLHPPVIDDVTETEFDGVGEILKGGDFKVGEISKGGQKDESGIPGEEKVKEGRRLLGGRLEPGSMMVVEGSMKRVESSMMVVEGRRRGSSLGFGRKLSLGIEQSHRRHSEHRLKVLQCC